MQKAVSTADALIAATKDERICTLVVSGALAGIPGFRLAPGQSLQGADDHASLTFAEHSDGLQLSSNNDVSRIRLNTASNKRAIFNDTNVDTLGRIALRGVTTNGRVQILARGVPGQGRLRQSRHLMNEKEISAPSHP